MSHYSKVKSSMKNRDCLVKALQDLGFKEDQIEVHDQPQTLYGYQGDARPEKANIIIRRKHVGGMANDIGFVLQEDGTYQGIISEYDQGNTNCRKNKLTQDTRGYSGRWMEHLFQRYSLHVVEEELDEIGFAYDEVYYNEEGQLKVEATKGF